LGYDWLDLTIGNWLISVEKKKRKEKKKSNKNTSIITLVAKKKMMRLYRSLDPFKVLAAVTIAIFI
jgi:hypothetical protein